MVTIDTREVHAGIAHVRSGARFDARLALGQRDAVRDLIEATARAESITPRQVILSARLGTPAVNEFVSGERWLPPVGLAKLATRLACDLDTFMALATRDGETVPPDVAAALHRYRNPFAAARIVAGLTIEDIAAVSGVIRDIITDFENGANIRPLTAERLCTVFPDNAAVNAAVLARVVPWPANATAVRRDAVRALIEATARSESITTRALICNAGTGDSDIYAFVTGRRWLSAVGLAKLALRLQCDLDEFVALATRDGETVPADVVAELPRYRHPFAAARLRAGLTATEVAARVGVFESVIRGFERGANVSPRTGRRLRAAFPDNECVAAAVNAQVVARPHLARTPLAKLFSTVCEARNLSIRAAAHELSLTGPGLTAILSGVVEYPRPENLSRLAQFLGLPERDVEMMIVRQPPPHVETGAVLRASRLAAELTQREAADAIGVSVAWLRAWEAGTKQVSARHASALREVFGS